MGWTAACSRSTFQCIAFSGIAGSAPTLIATHIEHESNRLHSYSRINEGLADALRRKWLYAAWCHHLMQG